jgi:hypothetical protein
VETWSTPTIGLPNPEGATTIYNGGPYPTPTPFRARSADPPYGAPSPVVIDPVVPVPAPTAWH